MITTDSDRCDTLETPVADDDLATLVLGTHRAPTRIHTPTVMVAELHCC